jgi:hypothetical protein
MQELSATALQTVGSTGYDGSALALALPQTPPSS